jgi:hypothetical protein
MNTEYWWNDTGTEGKTQVVSNSEFCSKIPHGLGWDCKQTSAVGGQ